MLGSDINNNGRGSTKAIRIDQESSGKGFESVIPGSDQDIVIPKTDYNRGSTAPEKVVS